MPFPVNTNIKIDLDTLLKNKNTILNVALLILVLIISSYIYSWQNRMNAIVKDKIILENKKNELLKRLAGSEKRLFDYKEILKKKDNSAIITTISHLAQELRLKILSVKPEQEQDFPIYTKSSIRLSILSEGFHRLGDFISKLETSADLYKIEVLNIKPGKAQAAKAATGKKPETEQNLGLSVDIVITRIAFKG